MLICIFGIIVLVLNIKAVNKNLHGYIKAISTLLFALSIIRYITVLLFSLGHNILVLERIRPLYLITNLTIPILFIITIWHITPLYREKISKVKLHILCAPWVVFYGILCVIKPYKVDDSLNRGYGLELLDNWGIYMNIFRIATFLILIGMVLYGYTLYRHKQIRGQYIVIIICNLLLLIDAISYFGLSPRIIAPFTLTEIFAFLGMYYGIAKLPIDARRK